MQTDYRVNAIYERFGNSQYIRLSEKSMNIYFMVIEVGLFDSMFFVHCYWLVNLPENYSVGPKVSGAIQCWDVKTGARILDVKIGFKISGRARFWDVNIGQKNWRVLRWGRRERWWCPQRRAYHPSLLPANGGGTQFSGWVRVGISELGVSEIGTWLVFQVEN